MDSMRLFEIVHHIVEQQGHRGIVYSEMSTEQKLAYASQCALALSVEVGELASSWPFASWKTTKVDVENIEREIIDCIFFLVNIASCFNITADDLEQRFRWVLLNNYKRIRNGEHKEVSVRLESTDSAD